MTATDSAGAGPRPTGVSASEGQVAGRAAGHGRAPGASRELRQPTPISRSERAVLRAQGQRRAARSDITNPEESTDPDSGEPDVDVRLQRQGQDAVPERHGGRSRSAATLGQRPGPDLRTSTSRSRSTTSWSPSRRSTSSSTRTGSPAITAPTSPAASRSPPRQDLANELRLRRAADQPRADLREPGLGDARQAGAAPRPDRRSDRACSSS